MTLLHSFGRVRHWWFGQAAAVLTLVLAASPAVADDGNLVAVVCRQGRVEMIVGGTGSAECPYATSPRRPPALHATSVQSSRLAVTVPEAVQRDRDRERRRILLSELAHEESRLALYNASADASAIARTRENVSALRHELARVPPEPTASAFGG